MDKKRNIIDSEYEIRFDDQDYNVFWNIERLEKYYKQRYSALERFKRRRKRRYWNKK